MWQKIEAWYNRHGFRHLLEDDAFADIKRAWRGREARLWVILQTYSVG